LAHAAKGLAGVVFLTLFFKDDRPRSAAEGGVAAERSEADTATAALTFSLAAVAAEAR